MTSYTIECWRLGFIAPLRLGVAPRCRLQALIRYRAAPSWAAEREAILGDIRAKLREIGDAV